MNGNYSNVLKVLRHQCTVLIYWYYCVPVAKQRKEKCARVRLILETHRNKKKGDTRYASRKRARDYYDLPLIVRKPRPVTLVMSVFSCRCAGVSRGTQ